MSQTITIPDGAFNLARDFYHNWPVVVGVLAGALLLSIVVEFIKHRYTKKQQQKMVGETAQKLLALLAAVFAGLGYLVPFLQENLVFLRTVPYVGEFAISIYAFANLLYALRFKTWFKVVTGWLTRQAKQPSEPEAPAAVETPIVASSDNLLS